MLNLSEEIRYAIQLANYISITFRYPIMVSLYPMREIDSLMVNSIIVGTLDDCQIEMLRVYEPDFMVHRVFANMTYTKQIVSIKGGIDDTDLEKIDIFINSNIVNVEVKGSKLVCKTFGSVGELLGCII